jgi:hypothetical protein
MFCNTVEEERNPFAYSPFSLLHIAPYTFPFLQGYLTLKTNSSNKNPTFKTMNKKYIKDNDIFFIVGSGQFIFKRVLSSIFSSPPHRPHKQKKTAAMPIVPNELSNKNTHRTSLKKKKISADAV